MSAFATFEAGIVRDDGVIVHVNGVEVYRDHEAQQSTGRQPPGARLFHGFRLSTGRMPSAAEQARLQQFFKEARAHYTARHTTGRDPEAMAWTMVGNVLFNLDEALTKG